MDALLSGLMGILGGIISGLVVAILSQRRNQAEIKRIEAETRKINSELETAQITEHKEILTTIHHKMHFLLGAVEYLCRTNRGIAMLNDKSDDYIRGLFEESEWSNFEIQELLESKDKAKTYEQTEVWHEYIQLLKTKNDFQDYIVEKEILIDDEELLDLCKNFNLIMNMFVETIRNCIRNENHEAYFVELHKLYMPDIDPLQRKIDDYIKSHLQPNGRKS
jgi:hypothetical protein